MHCEEGGQVPWFTIHFLNNTNIDSDNVLRSNSLRGNKNIPRKIEEKNEIIVKTFLCDKRELLRWTVYLWKQTFWNACLEQWCSGKLKSVGSSSLETSVIYSICKCDTRLSVWYLMREEKGMIWKGFVSPYWDLKQNLCLQNNLWCLNVKCGPKLLRNLIKSASMRLAAPSLHYITGLESTKVKDSFSATSLIICTTVLWGRSPAYARDI